MIAVVAAVVVRNGALYCTVLYLVFVASALTFHFKDFGRDSKDFLALNNSSKESEISVDFVLTFRRACLNNIFPLSPHILSQIFLARQKPQTEKGGRKCPLILKSNTIHADGRHTHNKTMGIWRMN